MISASSPDGLEWRRLVKPQSTTYTTPSMVIDVSAIDVATTTLRTPGGAGSKTRSCAWLERPE